MSLRFISVKIVCQKTGLSRSTIWRLIKKHRAFPKPHQISPGRVAWLENVVDEWIAEKCRKPDAKTESSILTKGLRPVGEKSKLAVAHQGR